MERRFDGLLEGEGGRLTQFPKSFRQISREYPLPATHPTRTSPHSTYRSLSSFPFHSYVPKFHPSLALYRSPLARDHRPSSEYTRSYRTSSCWTELSRRGNNRTIFRCTLLGIISAHRPASLVYSTGPRVPSSTETSSSLKTLRPSRHSSPNRWRIFEPHFEKIHLVNSSSAVPQKTTSTHLGIL